MQVFNTVPTDGQMASLLDPQGRSVGVKIEDTAEALVARPGLFPLWVVALSCSAVLGVAGWYWTVKAGRQGLDQQDAKAIAVFAVVALLLFVGVWAINRYLRSKGDYFVLDRVQRTLTLPRLNLTIPARQIQGFFELHAWHLLAKGLVLERSDDDDRDGASEPGLVYREHWVWTCELSVLVHLPNKQIARHPVVIGDSARKISRLGETLATFFQVERRVLKLDRKTRKQMEADARRSG
jgi:hypothetical protein